MLLDIEQREKEVIVSYYNKEGEVASNFAILQTDADGKVRQVPIELFKEKSEKEEEVPEGVLLN